MIKFFYTVLLVLVYTSSAICQINFEKGYVVTTNGNKIECLIKNDDWLNNPSEIRYKITVNDTEQIGNLTSIAEFRINGFHKYVRASVKIDRSPSDLENLSHDRQPIWSEQNVFFENIG